MFRFLIWLARRLVAGPRQAEQSPGLPVTLIQGAGALGSAGPGDGRGRLVTVRLPDGRLAEGEHVSESAGPGGAAGAAGGQNPTVVLIGQPGDGAGRPGGPRRHWYSVFPRWVRWGVPVVIIAVIFRRIVAWAVLAALSGALHLFGANVSLPHVTFGWPWSSSGSSSSTTLVGPLVLNKIEGIDKPALGSSTFDFMFTHSVNKPMGILPCWYSATFSAVGHASATVNLNPGAAWWKPATGHYVLKVLSKPSGTTPGTVTVTMALPTPQLPQSVHDVSVDNTLSKPVSTDHSWTYPGVACGVLVKPQFAQSVLYSQAQQEAFKQATTVKAVTQPLIAAAEKEASTIIGGNFITPTLNSLHYKVSKFTIRWIAPPAPPG